MNIIVNDFIASIFPICIFILYAIIFFIFLEFILNKKYIFGCSIIILTVIFTLTVSFSKEKVNINIININSKEITYVIENDKTKNINTIKFTDNVRVTVVKHTNKEQLEKNFGVLVQKKYFIFMKILIKNWLLKSKQ